MNAPFTPSPDPDELASALVDGLLSVEEAGRARQDPAVNRRVEEILRVRNQLRTTPPPPAGHAAQAVAAALAEYDPKVRPLRPPAPAPPARRPAGSRWLAVAAAILAVVLVAAVGLTTLGDDSDEDQTATMDSGSQESTENEGGGGDSSAAPQAPSADEDTSARDDTTSAEASILPGDVAQLGSVDTIEDLSQSVTSARTNPTPDDGAAGADEVLPPVPQSSSACAAASVAGDPARGTVTFVGQGTYRNVAVVVHVYRTDAGDEELVATSADCIDVVDVPFSG